MIRSTKSIVLSMSGVLALLGCGAEASSAPVTTPEGKDGADGTGKKGDTNKPENDDKKKSARCTIATKDSSGQLDAAFLLEPVAFDVAFASNMQVAFGDDGGMFVATGESNESLSGYTGNALVFAFDAKGKKRADFGDDGFVRVPATAPGYLQPNSLWSMARSRPTLALSGTSKGTVQRLTSTGDVDTAFTIEVPSPTCTRVGQSEDSVALSCLDAFVVVEPSGTKSISSLDDDVRAVTSAILDRDGSWVLAVATPDDVHGIERWKDGKRVPFAGGETRAKLPAHHVVNGIFFDDEGGVRVYGHVPSGTIHDGTTEGIWAIEADATVKELATFVYSPEATPMLAPVTRRCDGRYVSVRRPADDPTLIEVRHFDDEGKLVVGRGVDGVTTTRLPSPQYANAMRGHVDPATGRVFLIGALNVGEFYMGMLQP